MQHRKRSLLIGLGGLTLVAMLLTGAFFFYGHTSAAPKALTLRHLTAAGTANFTQGGTSSASGAPQYEIDTRDQDTNPKTDNSPSTPPSGVPTTNPNPKGNGITSNNPGFSGFNGLTHADQRLAGTGQYANTQFSLEPPDQGLCVGGNYVVEAVNNAMAVYTHSGTLVAGPTALSQFFNLSPEINRTTGFYGQFISDPKCYYDAQTNRWFLTELMQDNGSAGSGRNFNIIAVTQTANPTGSWSIFTFDVTDDGQNGTPNHAGCPCFGDQPLIGADSYGFYISTNEFGNGFNGSQVYAISKQQLVEAAEHSGALPAVVSIDAGAIPSPDGAGNLWYSIQPATSPKLGDEPNNGTEYFLSALQFGDTGPLDNRIAVWAMTGTHSLGSDNPNVNLTVKVIGSEVYGQPNPASQKAGPTPQGTSLGDSEGFLNTNDDRMNQVVFANGLLWSGVNTIIGDGNRTGIAYFIVQPGWHNGNLTASMAHQGYVALAGQNVFFPSIGVNANGQAVMVFSFSGPEYFPSTGYVLINAGGKAGKVHVAGAGVAPDDGFTCYPQYTGGNVGRWGDYSAAVAGPDGSIWMAAEYIPNAPRTALANWGTFINSVSPNSGE